MDQKEQKLNELYDRMSSDINNIAQTILMSCKFLNNFNNSQIMASRKKDEQNSQKMTQNEKDHRCYQSELRQQYVNYQNSLYNNHYKYKNIQKQAPSQNINHKYQILKMFEQSKGQQDFLLFQTNCVDNYICIGALWKSKIVNHFLFKQKSNDDNEFVDHYISLLNECEHEKERYHSKFEYDVFRKMKYERLRIVSNYSRNRVQSDNSSNNNEINDPLIIELQQPETIRKMNYPVMNSQYKLYQVMKQIVQGQIEQPDQRYNWAFKVQHIYSKIFRQQDNYTCGYCKQYIAYDQKYEAYLPPLVYQVKISQTNPIIYYHSQCEQYS